MESSTMKENTPLQKTTSSELKDIKSAVCIKIEENASIINIASNPDDSRKSELRIVITKAPTDEEFVLQGRYFDLACALVNERGKIVRGLDYTVKLGISLLLEDMTLIKESSMMELDPSCPGACCIGADGTCKTRVRINGISKNHMKQRFVIRVGAADTDLQVASALTRMMYVYSKKPKVGLPDPVTTAKAPSTPKKSKKARRASSMDEDSSSECYSHSPISVVDIPPMKRNKMSTLPDPQSMAMPSPSTVAGAFGMLSGQERMEAIHLLVQQFTTEELQMLTQNYMVDLVPSGVEYKEYEEENSNMATQDCWFSDCDSMQPLFS